MDGKGWTAAGEVQPGDRLSDGAGGVHAVAGIVDRGWITEQTVYNLDVGDLHTFVVQVDGFDILAHNRSYCGVHGNSLKCTCIHPATRPITEGALTRRR